MNMHDLGVDTSAPVRSQVTDQSQEELFDVSSTPSQMAQMSSNTLPSLPPTTDQQVMAVPSQSTVISMPSVQSVLSSV